ncbi:MAG: ribosomal-processing cysteine protease Prp [Spirochaetaceae bacterium]|jgi:uncharacterized protein YsxB (DUF464 family)|nr:ribosomal-processing cysteine protease Prp [Spirochaetaceae bacterium]
MIKIDVVLDKEDILMSCGISGHSESAPKGSDLVCAAVSVLAVAAERTFSGNSGIKLASEAPERGVFLLQTAPETLEGKTFLKAAGEFFLQGLSSVAEAYPDNCSIAIRRI